MSGRVIKIVLPLLGFIPVFVLALKSFGLLQDQPIVKASVFAILPAASLAYLAKSLLGPAFATPVLILSGLAWSCFLAYAFHRLATVLTASDFDWSSFRVGMIVGVIPGALVGWYLWIRLYKVVSLPTSCIVGGLLGGLLLGFYMACLWSKSK